MSRLCKDCKFHKLRSGEFPCRDCIASGSQSIHWQERTIEDELTMDCARATDNGSVEHANHDAHYRAIEAQGVEPIAVMEMIVCAGLPAEYHSTAKANLCRAMAVKYLLRSGTKDHGRKETDKAINYLHREQTGSWRK